MPEIPVGPEAGLLGRLVNGLFRVPAEDAFARELPVLARAAPSPAEFPSLHVDLHAQLVDAVKNGRDTSQLTRRVLTGAGPEGVGAFQTLDRYGEKIEYSRGGGSFHNTATGVHIDLDNGYAALSLVHEATHVRWVRAGRRAMVGKMGRSDFIDAMLVEETDAAVHKICANIYMQKYAPHLRLPDTGLQREFLAGSSAGLREKAAAAAAQGRALHASESARAAESGGTQAVLDAFRSGRVRTSTTGEPYPRYYGAAWDEYHHPRTRNG